MPQEKLAGPQVARFLVEQRHFRSPQAVSAVSGRIEPHEADPLVNQAGVLASTQVAARLHPAGKQPIVKFQPLHLQPGRDRVVRLLGDSALPGSRFSGPASKMTTGVQDADSHNHHHIADCHCLLGQ